MSTRSSKPDPEYRQTRAKPVRARSQASRSAIVQGAMAMWRTKGFAETSVTDICRAAGVSNALFYVYFSQKEDVLLELETFTMQDAHEAGRAIAARPYDLVDLITAVAEVLETRVRTFPPELIFESVLATYRLERTAIQAGATDADLAFLFLEPFRQAERDGHLPPGVDVVRAARVATMLLADGFRCWAAAGFGDEPLAPGLAREISAVVSSPIEP